MSFISPYKSGRAFARSLIGRDFVEVYVKCPIDVCKERDPKGLYKMAMEGRIENFTGISAPYEEPESPDVVVDTSIMGKEECVDKIIKSLREFSS